MSTPLLHTLRSYIPNFIVHYLVEHPEPPAAPTGSTMQAAVLFADISGFTALTERLAQEGLEGVEDLSRLLNDYFGQLIDTIITNGGDIVKFAGDALLALWPVPNTNESNLGSETLRATHTALIAQKRLKNYNTPHGQPLFLRIGIGAGLMVTSQLGGLYGRWEFLVMGQPLLQVNQAEHQAGNGDVVLSPQAWALVEEDCSGEEVESGCVRVTAVAHLPPATPTKLPALPETSQDGLQTYLPGAIRHRILAGQTGWLAELRRVSILFVNLSDLNYRTTLEQAQAVMLALQTALYRYEGSVNKISVDDKGATLVAALGLPPLSHEDDAVRALLAALDIFKALQALGLQCAIGVTSDRAFCGSIGNNERREYTMIGDVVNLAARLMQAAGTIDNSLPWSEIPILCDATTFLAANARIDFEVLPKITVKGKAEAIAVFRPLFEIEPISTQQMAKRIVGREVEQHLLEISLSALNNGVGDTIIIEGEAGIGKTQLLSEMVSKAKEMGVSVLLGSGDAIDRTTPYLAWQPIFQMMLGASMAGQTAVAPEEILSQIANESDFVERAPLLNAVLLTNLPETELTLQMTGEARASSTQALLVELLQRFITQPILLILEDAHWLDSASWALAFQVWRQISPLLFVIASRAFAQPTLERKNYPVTISIPEEFQRIQAAAQTKRIELLNLSLTETSALVCQQFNVDKIQEPIIDFIYRRAEGHPFFTQEMAYSLREAGFISLQNRQCFMTADVNTLHEMDFPDTIQSLITSRVDRLEPAQQIALKVASVIGRIFSFKLLYDIHPIAEDKPFLTSYLTTLSQQDLISQETPEPDLTYSFKHILTQEITYNLLLYSQRRQLHHAIAEWIEKTYNDNLSPYYSQLVHHWLEIIKTSQTEPEFVLRSIEYLALTGRQALRDGAYQEAINSLQKAIQIGRKWRDERGVRQSNIWSQMAQWHRMLGEAYFDLGQSGNSCHFFEQAILLSGETLPATPENLRLSLFHLAWRHLLYRRRLLRWLRPIGSPNSPEYIMSYEKAKAFRQLGHLYLSTNNLVLALFATLRSFELAAQINVSTELARTYANLYLLAALYRCKFLVRDYDSLARKTAGQAKFKAGLYRLSGHGEDIIQKMVEASDDLSTQAWVYHSIGQANIGNAPWVDVRINFRRAARIFEGLGDSRGYGDCLNTEGFVHYCQGEFRPSLEVFSELSQLGQRIGNTEYHVSGQIGQAANLLLLGQAAQAIALIQETTPLLAEIPEAQIYEVALTGLLGSALMRSGQGQAAFTKVETIIRWLDQPLPGPIIVENGFDGIAVVHLAKWQKALSTKDAQDITLCKETLNKTIEVWQQFSKRHRVCLPKIRRLQGSYHWLSHHRWLAHFAWHRSLIYSRKLAMPYEEAVSLLEIGRHMRRNNPLRKYYLNRAAAIFEKLEATYDLEQIKMMATS
jgi:class 3 adenylate cyclase/tetratricopeptide (TPR) repeat protein